MASRSLNKVQLIGNLTRDPELRYTPQGTAVCTFGLATNRAWTTDTGEKREQADFHRIIAWNKLAEICSQLLSKGRRVYVEGRLSTRSWTAQDGTNRQTTEINISDMIILDSKGLVEAVDVPGEEVTTEETPLETLGAAPAIETGDEVKADEEVIEEKSRIEKKEKKTEDEEKMPF